ncbi:MAG: glycosyltransferase family 4 protein, partial [Bacteroidales bacterium]|nr:glycosyltransferase family 4 protein [Bacteroidales bacterium]
MRLSGATIGFLSSSDLRDKRSLSGTMYTMAKSLESTGANVVWIPVKSGSLAYKLYRKFVKEAVRMVPKLGSRLPRHYLWSSRIAARNLDAELVESCDVLFAPMQSVALFSLETGKPIVYFSDTTFRLMIDYYWSNLPERDIREGDRIEQRAVEKAAALVYPCRWAAESAVRDYGQPREKISLALFGPNLDVSGIVPHEFRFDGHLDLLFVGVDWRRKGGFIAVEACEWLNRNGVDSTLHVVGIKSLDPKIASLPFVEDHGFLDKNKPGDYSRIVSLYSSADCFILPTMAECTGVSFCEASAFGLPCFTHDTGGVSDYVIDGINGRLLPPGSSGEDFGGTIKACVEDGSMERMSLGATAVSRERLTWDKW